MLIYSAKRAPVWITSIPFRTFYLYFLNVTILNDFFQSQPQINDSWEDRGSDYEST